MWPASWTCAAESLLEAARVALAQVRQRGARRERPGAAGRQRPAADLPPPLGRLEDLAPLTELPAGIDSSVLQRRPTCASSRPAAGRRRQHRRRRAAFPRITLTGSVGRASGDLSDLFKHSAWSFAPQLVMPLFDAGRNRANLAQVRAARETALAQYEKGHQTAFRRSPTPWLPATCWPSNAGASSPAQRRAPPRDPRTGHSDAGVASSLDLLDAQRSAFAAEQALVQTQACRRKTWWVCGGRWAVTRAMAPSAEPGD